MLSTVTLFHCTVVDITITVSNVNMLVLLINKIEIIKKIYIYIFIDKRNNDFSACYTLRTCTFAFWDICWTSPKKQDVKLTKFEVLWMTSAHDAKRLLFLFEFLIRWCQLTAETVLVVFLNDNSFMSRWNNLNLCFWVKALLSLLSSYWGS